MLSKRFLFVYNPIAGRGKIQRNMQEIINFYDSHDCILTLCPAISLEKYKEILFEGDCFNGIICSGGDGTLNLLMNFLVKNEIRMDVGYLPAGSTNDYANTLGLSSGLKRGLEQTLEGTPHLLDVGKFNQNYFLYVAAFGLFTKVSYATPQKTKNLLGHTAYVLEGIKQISDLNSYAIKIETEDVTIEGSFMLGLITNSLFIGGFRDILPGNSALDDGIFEILLLRKPKKLFELHEMIIALTQNSLSNNSNVVLLRSANIKITSTCVIDWTIDGEFGGYTTEVSIQNVNKAFSIIC